MRHPRVIPALLLKGKGLVKGVNYKDHQYVGDPINTLKIFNEKEVDEIVFLDILATIQKQEPNYILLERIATEAFMPFAYGGGINKSDQAKRIFSLGVEKIILGTAAIENPGLIREIADFSGSQSVIISLDVRKSNSLKYQLYSHSGSKPCSVDLDSFLDLVQDKGAGEILLNNIDRDGTKTGYDTGLISYVSKKVSIPVVACCGAWNLDHIRDAVIAGADATAAGSMFVYQGKFNAVLINYPKYDNLVKIFNTTVGE